MFHVVIGHDWCSVVPESWIDFDNKFCMWPSHGSNVSKAIKKSLPPQASWESVMYKYMLGPYDSFEEAKSKEKDAEFVSSDDAKINALKHKENILSSKRVKKPKIYSDYSDVESTDIDSIREQRSTDVSTISEKSSTKSILKQKNIVTKSCPSPPCNYKVYTEEIDEDVRKKDTQQNYSLLPSFDVYESQPLHYGDEFSSSSEESLREIDYIEKNSHRETDSYKDTKRNRYPQTFLKKIKIMEKRPVPVIKHIDYNSAIQIKKGMKPESRKSDSALQMQQNEEKEMDVNTENETSNKENAQKESVSKSLLLDTVVTMDKKLTTLNTKMDSLLAFHDQENPTLLNYFLDLLPDFPLCSVENFQKFCNDLNENEELRKQFQKKIRSIGGKSAENHLVNCLIITLTNELAKHFTWEGQTEGIKNTAFANIIISTISNLYTSSSYYSLKNKFSK